MPLKLKKHRASIEFEYEFEDGTSGKFTYFATTTNQIERAFKIKDDDTKGQLDLAISLLEENIKGDNVEKLMDEVREGNIFDFKETLDVELGKLKKKR
ncbi:MAG: hypothetical protein IE890_10840 [Arcobacter sp.]|nr:hypothetical protein [Arcobacter sp.]